MAVDSTWIVRAVIEKVRGEDKEVGKSGREIEKRGSSRVIGLRRFTNIASSLYSFFMCVNPINPDSSHSLQSVTSSPPPFLDSLSHLYWTHSKYFPSSFTFSSSLAPPFHTYFSRLAYSTTLLTPQENEHQGRAPKG